VYRIIMTTDTCTDPEISGIETVFRFEIPKELQIIKWEEALEQVGGDKEFLKEVLDDLSNETEEALHVIESGIEIGDFVAIERAAHRIKGSASYLCCERLQAVSLELQMTAHGHDNHKFPRIKVLFELFKECVKEILEEI
jgi:HPt (histidine-containing phosphotransfer) domain-containing protein